jgi:hypothetical protein
VIYDMFVPSSQLAFLVVKLKGGINCNFFNWLLKH